MASSLPSPRAETPNVSQLVEQVSRGKVRVPVYQRALKWEARDVLNLFDSLYRGYPIGSLLLHARSAPAEVLRLGPLRIDANEESAAMAVVDGQQRLVALAASLSRPLPLPEEPEDPFVVYFDPRQETFEGPPADGPVPSHFVPLPVLGEGSRVLEWLFHWEHGEDEALRQRVMSASTRIREYKVPTYIIEVEEERSGVLEEIFYRVNNSGKPLTWPEVHDALYGRRSEARPSSLGELADALAELGFGRPSEEELLRYLIAFEGRDVTRSVKVHRERTPNFLEGTAAEALPTLRRVIGFLRRHAEIPHLRLIPRTAPLTLLTRFFRLHPEPSPRTLTLLRRVTWRALLSRIDDRTFQRRGVSEIVKDEVASAERLVRLLPKRASPFTLPRGFDARAAESRIAMLGLASLGPRDLETRRPIDVAAWIEEAEHKAFRRVLLGSPRLDRQNGPENRALLPARGGASNARGEVARYLASEEADEEVLRSHAISNAAAEALRGGDSQAFLEERARALEEVTKRFTERLAEWDASDRPSIDVILGGAR